MYKKICIFDFDGTLVNTIEDVAICFNECRFVINAIRDDKC